MKIETVNGEIHIIVSNDEFSDIETLVSHGLSNYVTGCEEDKPLIIIYNQFKDKMEELE